MPQDRLKRSARVNVNHFRPFDDQFVNDCFPTAASWLKQRLANAITRRRQHLIYERQHHQKLACLDKKHKPILLRASTNEESGNSKLTPPATIVQVQAAVTQIGLNAPPLSTRLASTRATEFVHGIKTDAEAEEALLKDIDLISVSTGATLSATYDTIHIPPRPRGQDGTAVEEFECPYCFCIQNIKSDSVWK